MKRLLILDTETTGLDPKVDQAIEVGAVLWSVEHRTVLSCFSALIEANGNAAEAVNGIPSAALLNIEKAPKVWQAVEEWGRTANAVVAHNADFDRSFVPRECALHDLPWICSCDDIQWPRASDSRSLVALALAHGVGVSYAHRALTDCLLLARLLERCAELGHDVAAMLARGLRPKATFAANVTYETNHLAKAAGFRWDPQARRWWRKMAIEDVTSLPFKVRQIA